MTALTAEVEAAGGGGFRGGPAGGVIEDGRIKDDKISFRTGMTTYQGTVNGERIELRRSAPAGRGGRAPGGPADARARPAIGPPPDGSDPSVGGAFSRGGQPAPLILRRVMR